MGIALLLPLAAERLQPVAVVHRHSRRLDLAPLGVNTSNLDKYIMLKNDKKIKLRYNIKENFIFYATIDAWLNQFLQLDKPLP